MNDAQSKANMCLTLHKIFKIYKTNSYNIGGPSEHLQDTFNIFDLITMIPNCSTIFQTLENESN
jgi:hypothetical protein